RGPPQSAPLAGVALASQLRFAPDRSAPLRFALLRSAWASTAPASLAPLRSQPGQLLLICSLLKSACLLCRPLVAGAAAWRTKICSGGSPGFLSAAISSSL